MPRHSFRTACGALMALLLVSCSSSTDLLPGPGSGSDLPLAQPMKVWFTQGEDLHLAYEYGVPSGDALLDRSREALSVLLQGPSRSTAAEGVTTQIPQATELGSVRLAQEGNKSVLVVELSEEFVSAENQPLAIGQVIYTASQFAGEGRIRIEADGETIAEGTKEAWIDRLEPIVLRHPIYIDEPAEIAAGTVAVRGNAVGTGRTLVLEVSTDDGPPVTRKLQLSCKGGPECRDRFVANLSVPGCATEGLLQIELLNGGKAEATKEVPLAFARPPSCDN